MKTFTTHIITASQAGLTVEQYVKDILACSGRKMQRLTRQKGILLNGRSVFLQKKLKVGDKLGILDEVHDSYGVLPEAGALEILYEDSHLLVLNKPARQLVHPAGRTTGGTLANYLAFHLQQQGLLLKIRPLHRLDRDTSGCVIFAKDSHSQFLLEQQLKDGRLKRTYLAVTAGCPNPADGIIDAPLGDHPHLPNRRIVRPDGETAVTHYRTLQTLGTNALVELELQTGRTHQIRLHAAHHGCPVLGDAMYGQRSGLISRQALHAAAVTFCSLSTGQPITVQAPLPADFQRILSPSP